MKKIIENYRKETPPAWKRLGDFSLVMIPTIVGIVPTMHISQNAKDWTVQIAAVLLVGVKFWTGTKVDKTKYEGSK